MDSGLLAGEASELQGHLVDGRGVEVLSKLAGEGIKVVDCCELIKELLEVGGKR